MAHDFVSASSHDLLYANPHSTAAAYCFSGWFYRDNSTISHPLNFLVSGDASPGLVVISSSSVAGDIDVIELCSGTDRRRSSSTGITINTWTHVFLESDNTLTNTGLKIYFGNVEVSYTFSNTGTGSKTAYNGSWAIGSRHHSSDRYFDGRMANFGYWNRLLSAGDRAALASGARPRLFPKGLKWAPELILETYDTISGVTPTGTTNGAIEHPRTLMGEPDQVSVSAVGVAGGASQLINSAGRVGSLVNGGLVA
jgi:hypothetical protein